MPDFATVLGNVHCPACKAKLFDSVRCQWGELPKKSCYSLGDKVSWLHDVEGNLFPPYTLVAVAPNVFRWNCGDPQYLDVVLFDLDIYAAGGGYSCPQCAAKIDALVAVVHDGSFRAVLAIDGPETERLLGASRGKADIAIILANGATFPREDWFDKTIQYRGTTTTREEPCG